MFRKRSCWRWKGWLGTLAVVLFVWVSMVAAPSGTGHFFYLSDRRVITLEVVSAGRVILNYINLGDSFELIDAKRLVFVDARENVYHGQVILLENAEDPRKRFGVTDLLKPGQFVGYTILGGFQFQTPPQKALLRVGSAILELEPLSRKDFELVAARIEEMDLARDDRRIMIIMSGFDRGYGQLYVAGSESAEALSGFFPERELWPPILLTGPSPLLPAAGRELPDPVEVKIQLIVTRAAGIQDLKVVQGVHPEVDRVALQALRNSWRFLPAVSNDKVVDTQFTVTVRFLRER